MTPGVRALALLGLLAAFLGLGTWLSRTSHGSGVHGVASPSVVDSSAAVRVRDSLAWERKAHAHDLDGLRAALDRNPDTVWRVVRRLVLDTVDTGRVDTLRLVARLVVDDSACRVDRDSLTGEVMLWKARDAARAEALALCQRSLGGMPAPLSGSTTWTVSGVLQADGEALRPGVGLDWRQGRFSVGAEGYVRRDGTRPGVGLRFGFNFRGW